MIGATALEEQKAEIVDQLCQGPAHRLIIHLEWREDAIWQSFVFAIEWHRLRLSQNSKIITKKKIIE